MSEDKKSGVLLVYPAIILFMLFCTVIGSCTGGGYNKKAEDAYQRLKKEGISDKQIYEMGK